MLRFFHSPSTKTVQRGCASVARNFAALKNATTFAYVSGIKVASAASAPGAMSLAINRLTNPILLNDFIRCFQVISNPGVVMTGTGDPCNPQGLGRAADKKRGQARCRHASQILHGWPAVNRSKANAGLRALPPLLASVFARRASIWHELASNQARSDSWPNFAVADIWCSAPIAKRSSFFGFASQHGHHHHACRATASRLGGEPHRQPGCPPALQRGSAIQSAGESMWYLLRSRTGPSVVPLRN